MSWLGVLGRAAWYAVQPTEANKGEDQWVEQQHQQWEQQQQHDPPAHDYGAPASVDPGTHDAGQGGFDSGAAGGM